jgi:hypothetical protein
MELNVWTSSTVTKAVQDPNTGRWFVTVETKLPGTETKNRVLIVKHLIFAQGFSGGRGYVPHYPGMVGERSIYITSPRAVYSPSDIISRTFSKALSFIRFNMIKLRTIWVRRSL